MEELMALYDINLNNIAYFTSASNGQGHGQGQGQGNDLENIIFIKYNDAPFIIETPYMRCPFGIEKEYTNYILKLEFSDIKNNPAMNKFYNLIKHIEDINKDKLVSLYGDKYEYKSEIRQTGKYQPQLICKIPNRFNKLEVDVYDIDNNHITTSDIKANSWVKCFITVSYTHLTLPTIYSV